MTLHNRIHVGAGSHCTCGTDEIVRLRAALFAVAKVEPRSGTARLDVADWSNALDRAQRIAAEALDD